MRPLWLKLHHHEPSAVFHLSKMEEGGPLRAPDLRAVAPSGGETGMMLAEMRRVAPPGLC
jgi:hypothetical protein